MLHRRTRLEKQHYRKKWMPGLTPAVSYLRVRIRAQALKNPPLFLFYEKGMEGDFFFS
jgi:hypothetical protein